LGQWAIDSARETPSAFSLPHYDADQLEVLRIAASKIGMPYVWGGTTPRPPGRPTCKPSRDARCSGLAYSPLCA
jgi:cell wall-associated NlpC family hydrolase